MTEVMKNNKEPARYVQVLCSLVGIPLSGNNNVMVTPAGVEPAIFWMRTRRPGPLDEGATAEERAFCARTKSHSEHVVAMRSIGAKSFRRLIPTHNEQS